MANGGSTGKPVAGSYHVKLTGVPGAESGLLFYMAQPPGGSLESPDFKTWDAQNNPVNSLSGAQQVSWSEATLARGVDDNKELWEWFQETKEKGAEETKKDIQFTVFNATGDQLQCWNLVGATITNYNPAALNAQANEILIETVSIKCEDVTME